MAPNIRQVDMLLIDDIFESSSGYVLDFSNYTFSRFFSELNIDIDDPKYSVEGGSKGKRLRYFLQNVDKKTAIRTLEALWEYREVQRERANRDERVTNAHGKLLGVIERISGMARPTGTAPPPAFNRDKIKELQRNLIELSRLDPQPRGYAFEKFLKEFFDAYHLDAKGGFRLRGEQIDGSFVLGAETYLLEAKWHNAPTGNDQLHAFHGKLDQKAAWARGLFVSYSGFTADGLVAFGRGKRLICMDGLDLSDVLGRELPLAKVLEAKLRRATETGEVFVRVRDLF